MDTRVGMGQVVDTESAREFMREALQKISKEELDRIAQELESKSQWFRQKLAPEEIPKLSSADFLSLLRQIFATRRKAEAILKQIDLEDLRRWTWNLLYGAGEIETRFQSFVDSLDCMEGHARRD